MKRFFLWGATSLVLLVFSLLILELGSFVLVRNHLLTVNETPRLYQGLFDGGFLNYSDFRTEEEEWGAWHTKNAKAKQDTPCFAIEYASNEVGARGPSFLGNSAQSVVLLGDSFAEGYGVKESETAANQLSQLLHVPVLNFGTAGNFGPVQEWLIYERLAKHYPHERLVLFVLPENDFTDNDYAYWQANGLNKLWGGAGERYRPYYQKTATGYSYFIPKDAVKYPFVSEKASWSQFLKDHFWFSNSLRTARIALLALRENTLRNQSSASPVQNPAPNSVTNTKSTDTKVPDKKASDQQTPQQVVSHKAYSGYFDASSEQQLAALHFIDQIIAKSPAKEIVIVAIPVRADLERIANGANRHQQAWWQALRTASTRLHKPVQFLDLVDTLPKDFDNVFLGCDGHWSAKGNRLAAEAIAKTLSIAKP